eukprot:SM000030S11452  [mRNA]  locus=s30:755702:756719:- [translate_table: standard]
MGVQSATAGGCHKRCTAYAEGIAGTPPNKPAMSGWTGIQLHRRFLNSSKEHCRSPRRLDRPSVAPPIPELTQRALPFSQCRQFASFAGMPNMEQEGIVIALLVVLMMFIFLGVNIALDEELTLLIWEQERKASEHQAKRRRLWSYERSTIHAHTLLHGYDEGLFKSRVRVSRNTFQILCQKLGPSLQRHDTNMRKAVPVGVCILVTLHRLASGSYLNVIADLFGPGTSTTCKIIVEKTVPKRSRELVQDLAR